MSELAGGDGDHTHHHQGQDGQRNVQVEHGAQEAHHSDGAVQQLGQALAHQHTKGIDVVGVVGHDISVGVGVKVLHGQLLHVLEHLIPEVPQGALGDVDHEAGLDEGGQNAHAVVDGHPGDGPHQGGKVGGTASLDSLDHGQDIVVNEGLGKEGALDGGEDRNKDADYHQDQVEPVVLAHKLQDPGQGGLGVLQLGAGTAPAAAGTLGNIIFLRCHYSSPPSSKSPLPLVWDSKTSR